MYRHIVIIGRSMQAGEVGQEHAMASLMSAWQERSWEAGSEWAQKHFKIRIMNRILVRGRLSLVNIWFGINF